MATSMTEGAGRGARRRRRLIIRRRTTTSAHRSHAHCSNFRLRRRQQRRG